MTERAYCEECGRMLRAGAACPCGESSAPLPPAAPETRRKSDRIAKADRAPRRPGGGKTEGTNGAFAFALSMVFVGLGHAYAWQAGRGAIFVGVGIGGAFLASEMAERRNAVTAAVVAWGIVALAAAFDANRCAERNR